MALPFLKGSHASTKNHQQRIDSQRGLQYAVHPRDPVQGLPGSVAPDKNAHLLAGQARLASFAPRAGALAGPACGSPLYDSSK